MTNTAAWDNNQGRRPEKKNPTENTSDNGQPQPIYVSTQSNFGDDDDSLTEDGIEDGDKELKSQFNLRQQ